MSQMPPGAPINYSTPPQKPSSGLAVAALIVGIVSIFPGCCLGYWTILPGIVAIVLAVMARKAIAEGRASGSGMALGGMITGIVGLIIGIAMLILLLVAGPAAQKRFTNFWQQQQQQMQQQQQQQQNSTTTQGS